MVLHNPAQADQLTIYVVQDLDLCGLWSFEIKRCAAGEHLNVALVRRKQREQRFCKTAFAAQIGLVIFCKPLLYG